MEIYHGGTCEGGTGNKPIRFYCLVSILFMVKNPETNDIDVVRIGGNL
ncbi:MAG: hypothetical protein IPL26_29455 [Leptospiraceae bacterium]|nr:hypothetical protein [Leptospiraceae bacterium]